MTIAKDSTSYPTLSVIQEFNLSGEIERVIWVLADYTVKFMYSGMSIDPIIALRVRLASLTDKHTAIKLYATLYERLHLAHKSYQKA